MAAGWTNKGLYRMVGIVFRADTMPANFYVALVTSAVPANEDTNTLGALTQIASANGYTSGGLILSRNGTDFDSWVEDDTANASYVQIKNLVWTATGGPIPGSGSNAAQAVLTDANATIADREVWAYADLSTGSCSSGQTFTIPDFELRLKKP